LSVALRQDGPIRLDAALDCAPGELVAVVGPSGSGKTTLLRSIAGLHHAAFARITVGREVWTDTERGIRLSPQRRRVGFVFQDYALFPHLSALDNVAIALGHLSRAERVRRARALLELVRLSGLDDRHPAQLSGGQRQRVALARALARDPVVLLLDEPFSAVDQVTRRKLQRELVLLRRLVRIPTVLVTHDLAEAVALADRLVVLHRGRSLQAGAPRDVVRHPDSALVARLMDQNNLFDGIVRAHRPERGLTELLWRNRVLEATLAPGFAPGSPVTWLVPPSHIVLHRRGRPSLGERENPVPGTVSELVLLGETALVTMAVDGDATCILNFSIPAHAAERNGLEPGADIRVSLLADGIHLMPYDPTLGESAR
jgi:molybdate transport system ATP-binding protein